MYVFLHDKSKRREDAVTVLHGNHGVITISHLEGQGSRSRDMKMVVRWLRSLSACLIVNIIRLDKVCDSEFIIS